MKEIILPKIVSTGIFNAQHLIKSSSVSKNRKTVMFEIELSISSGGISYIDGSSHPITENLVICAKPGQTRHTHLPFMCYFLHIIVNEGELYDILTTLPNYLELQDTSEIREIFVSLAEHYGTGLPENDIILESLILKLIYCLKRATPLFNSVHNLKGSNRQAIEDTIAYIIKNPTADLRLEALAKKAKFTPVYFHKLFKASTGKNLREFVEHQRIKKSVELLISSDMTLAEISYECGFSSQSYFSYAFKRNMSLTPREYVKKLLCEYGEIK